MHRGYVKLWRKTIDTGMMTNHRLFVFWTWCLLKASYKDCETMVGYQKIELKAGQFVFGRLAAAKELGMSERNVRTCMKSLEKSGNVTIKATNKFSVVSIVNWHAYQQEDCKGDQQTDQQVTNNRPTSDQQVTTNKNVKNEETLKELFLSDSVEIGLAERLLEKIRRNNPDFKKPNLQSWARAFELMLGRDGRTPEAVEAMIDFSQTHHFWHKNILSADKLRKQFDRLVLERGGNGNGGRKLGELVL